MSAQSFTSDSDFTGPDTLGQGRSRREEKVMMTFGALLSHMRDRRVERPVCTFPVRQYMSAVGVTFRQLQRWQFVLVVGHKRLRI